MLGFGALRESEVLDFHQRDGENMKKAWDRISEAHRRIMPWIPIKIVLRNFYHGLFKWCMKGFIDIGKGHIRLRGKAKGKYLFPRKKKNELVENKFEGFYDSDDLGDL